MYLWSEVMPCQLGNIMTYGFVLKEGYCSHMQTEIWLWVWQVLSGNLSVTKETICQRIHFILLSDFGAQLSWCTVIPKHPWDRIYKSLITRYSLQSDHLSISPRFDYSCVKTRLIIQKPHTQEFALYFEYPSILLITF